MAGHRSRGEKMRPWTLDRTQYLTAYSLQFFSHAARNSKALTAGVERVTRQRALRALLRLGCLPSRPEARGQPRRAGSERGRALRLVTSEETCRTHIATENTHKTRSFQHCISAEPPHWIRLSGALCVASCSWTICRYRTKPFRKYERH